MRVVGSRAAIVGLIAATSVWAQAPSSVETSREAPGSPPPKADADVAGLFRFEPTGPADGSIPAGPPRSTCGSSGLMLRN